MKVFISLILLLACIVADANDEGPSDYLQSKWRKGYLILNHLTPRCFKSCSPDQDDLYWNAILGKAAHSLTESRFMVELTKQFNDSKDTFDESIQNNLRLGVKSLDTDKNNLISAEEFYTEYICLGFDLKIIKIFFDFHKTIDNGIPYDELVHTFVHLFTENNETDTIDNVFNYAFKHECHECLE